MTPRNRFSRRATPTGVTLQAHGDPGRVASEQFIRDGFARAYSATIRHFMPLLMSLYDPRDKLQAVLGLRRAAGNPLFLEQYLNRPVEQALSAALSRPVDRAAMMEVGNFAVGTAGGGRWLITALTAFLKAARLEWAIFTCGPELQNAFHRLGVELIDLGLADPQHLPVDERSLWGSYYEQRPRIMAAQVAQSYATLIKQRQHNGLSQLWRNAELVGTEAA